MTAKTEILVQRVTRGEILALLGAAGREKSGREVTFFRITPRRFGPSDLL